MENGEPIYATIGQPEPVHDPWFEKYSTWCETLLEAHDKREYQPKHGWWEPSEDNDPTKGW